MPHIEQSDLPSKKASVIAEDIARHFYATQFLPGAAIIVASNPSLLLGLVRQNWLQRLSTLERHHAEASLIAKMATMRFSQFPEDERTADIFFIAPSQLGQWLPPCHTAYVTCGLGQEELEKIQKCVAEDGLIVQYAH